MQFTPEHEELKRTIERFVEQELNPHVDEWEEAGIFPAHEVFRKLGALGLLGLTKPEAYGGAGLDYSYSVLMAEALGNTRCGGVPMAIGVQTDMATPALARFGSDELRAEFLAPAIAGDVVACLGVSEPGAGSDVASIRTTARKDGDDYVINGGKLWITNGTQADWMCLPGEHQRGQPPPQQVADHRADGEPGRQHRAQAAQDRHELVRHRADLLRRRARAAAPPDRRGGQGLHLPDAAVPGGAAVGRGECAEGLDNAVRDTIEYTRSRKIFGRRGARQPGRALHAGRAADRSRGAARARPTAPRAVRRRQGRDRARLDGQAQGRAAGPRGRRPACSTGAAWASPGRTRSRACTATGAWCRSVAARTR